MMPLLAIYHFILIIFSFTLCVCEGVFVFRAVEGETVYLPCHSPPNDSVQVSVEWTKHSTSSTTICQWNINSITGSHTGDCFPHFKFNRKSFTLSIENVQLSDSGHYSCKTTRVIPPPTLDNTTNVTLQVEVRPHLYASYSSTQTQRSIQLTSQKDSDKELEQNFPVVCMAIFSFFIICIVFIWILFCVSKHKTSN